MAPAMADNGWPTRATPITCPVSPRIGPVQYRVVPDGSVLRKTYFSPWASLRPASTAATAGSDTNSPLDEGTAAGPSGPTAITSFPCRSRTCRRRLGTAALAITGVSKRCNAAVSWEVVASGTPVVAAAARSVVSRAASTRDRWSLASKLARSRLPLNSATDSLVTRAVTAAVPMVPMSATMSTKGPTIFARRDRRMRPTSPIIEQGACAERCARSPTLRRTLHLSASDAARRFPFPFDRSLIARCLVLRSYGAHSRAGSTAAQRPVRDRPHRPRSYHALHPSWFLATDPPGGRWVPHMPGRPWDGRV